MIDVDRQCSVSRLRALGHVSMRYSDWNENALCETGRGRLVRQWGKGKKSQCSADAWDVVSGRTAGMVRKDGNQ